MIDPASGSPSSLTPAPPETAPAFSSRNQYGQPVTLGDLAGAPAVLVFFPYAFTGICTGELQELRDLSAEFAACGARVLGISCDSMFSLRTFAEAESFGFDLLTDHWPHGQIARAYGVFDESAGVALRGSFVLDAQARITWRVVNQIGEARAMSDHLLALRQQSS
ncbi:MAG: peroxiredoxin [Propionibacteriales bacterium]|nr:peroxiredoxin [Propionibacteriales bacterium]